MVKEKRILSYFLGWLIVGLCIIFVGVNNVFALEYEIPNRIQFYDNSGNELTALGNSCNDVRCISGTIATYIAGSYGGAIALQLDTQLIQGYNYSITIFLDIQDSNNDNIIELSKKNYIGLGSNFTEAKNNYINQTGVKINSSSANFNYIYYNFTVTSNGSFQNIVIPFATNISVSNAYVRYYGSELVINGNSLSQNDITNITNNQTNELNNSIQNSTDTITGEIDDMEQSIIDSNKETQEVIKEQFNDCYMNLLNWTRPTFGTIVENNDGSFNWSYPYAQNLSMDLTGKLKSGTYTLSNFGDITLYIQKNASDYTNSVTGNGNYKTFYYDGTSYLRLLYAATTPNISQLFKLSLVSGNISKPYSPYNEEICTNKIDETNDKLDNIAGAITDESSPNLNGLENSAGWLPAGPVDSILNLPLTMLNSLTNSLGRTCNPLNVELPYVKTNIQIPCLSSIFNKIEGANGLWTWAGAIASVLILYNYLLNLYAWVDRVLTLRAEFDEAMGADLANWGRL